MTQPTGHPLIVARSPFERSSDAWWPIIEDNGMFRFDPNENVRWIGSADIWGTRRRKGAAESDVLWNIAGFAFCVVTNRRILYRGPQLAVGSTVTVASPSPLPFGPAAMPVFVGQIRVEWISLIEVARGRLMGMVPVGILMIAAFDAVSQVGLRVGIAPRLRYSSAKTALTVAQRLADDTVSARGGNSDARTPLVEDGVHRWRIPGALRIGASPNPAPQPTSVDIGANRDARAAQYLSRYRSGGEASDLDKAIETYRTALAATPEGHHLRPVRLAALGGALHTRYDRRGARSDLDESLQAFRSSLNATSRELRPFPTVRDLGDMLWHLFQETGSRDLLDEAIATHRVAIGLCDDDAARGVIRRSLARSLRTRTEHSGSRLEIDEAVEQGRLDYGPLAPDSPQRHTAMADLATSLTARFHTFGEPADADEAIALLSTVTEEEEGNGGAADPGHLTTLGIAYFYRHQHEGDLNDLHSAIRAWRTAVDRTPTDHRLLSPRLQNLANGLLVRFQQLRELADLGEAVVSYRRAADLARGPNRLILLANLSTALRERYQQTNDLRNLDEAIEYARVGLTETPDGDAHGIAINVALANSLARRFQRANEMRDLDEAIACIENAQHLAPPGHPRLPMLANNLAMFKLSRARATENAVDLNRAVESARQAAAATDPQDPAFGVHQQGLGLALQQRYETTAERADIDIAIEAFQTAAGARNSQTTTRLSAARHWADSAARLGRWAEAADGYETAVTLMPRLASLGLQWGSRTRALSGSRDFASDAAAACLNAGDIDRAVRLLELGRGVMWSQLSDARTDLAQLEQAAPQLARRLNEVRRHLDGGDDDGAELAADGRRSSVDMQIDAARRWDDLVGQVRQIPGFADFLRLPRMETLRRATTGGPVAIINVSQWRCDALIVTTSGVEMVPLPALSRDEALARTDTFLGAIRMHGTLDSDAREAVISQTLEWLWDTVAQPVLARLHRGKVARRVWWSPTGSLTLLPLHAAGYHKHPASGHSCLDRIVSSYAPTLRSLLRARGLDNHPDRDDAFLVIGLRKTPDQPELPGVDREIRELKRLRPAPTMLREAAATVASVRQELSRHTHVHFSCHGSQRLDDPSMGGLHLHDGLLTIREIGEIRNQRGGFAFLSACQTATGGMRVPDEAMSITSALLYCGWRHIVGTLWSVGDTTAAEITTSFYGHATTTGVIDPDRAADALHQACVRQRRLHPERPSTWAPFVHVGP